MRSMQSELKNISTRIDLLQVGYDASRLNHNEFCKAVLEKIDFQRTLLDANHNAHTEIPKLIEHLSAVQVEKLDRQHALLDANHAVQAQNVQLSTLLMSRADYILQRITISLGRDVLIRTPEGFLLAPVEDPALVAALWESGGLEPGTIRVLTALLREGDHAIDVGAHIGLTVLPAARRVGPTGRIIAFEPGSRAGELLQQNLALNFLSERVSLYTCAAGEAPGMARLNLGQISGHSSLLALPNSDKGEEVKVRTIDSLVPKGTRVRLAKLDVEGFEPQVWRGMQRLIADNPGLIVLVEFCPNNLRRAGILIEDWLTEFLAPDFTAYEVDEVTGHIRPLRSLVELAAADSLNLLLLRQPPMVFPELYFE